MKLPNISSLRKTKRGFIVLAVLVLCIGGAGFAYFGHNTSTVYNASGYHTHDPQNPISTTNSNKSDAGTISVPSCTCKLKDTQTQPGQTSTSGTTLQNGTTGSTQIQTCNPCPMDEATSSAVVCPEYLCRTPTPTPSPTPVPTPTPTPTRCGTCGGGYRKAGTASSMYVCPMICFQ